MANIDLKKTYGDYRAKAAPAIVELPARPYLMIDGTGDPNTSEEYVDAIQTLYPLAYGLRAAVKKLTGDGYTVMPLEGLWWVEDMRDFDVADKSNWHWTSMICLPDLVTQTMADEVLPAVSAAKRLPSGDKARFEMFTEGTAAQILHIGPYADEGSNISALHQFIEEQGYSLAGKHHEIYLSDARKTDPSKLRTIIRQPFANG